jgi:hypothetical protein
MEKEIPNAQVEGITLTVEPGIIIPMLLLHRSDLLERRCRL